MKLGERLLLLVTVFAVPVFAQLDRGSLTGEVKDPSGAAVSGAKVTATQLSTNSVSSTTTTESGDYTLPALLIGTYRMTVEAAGFKRSVNSKIDVTSGSTLRLDFTIWKNKVHRARPVLCEADVFLADFRKWARQFYTNPA